MKNTFKNGVMETREKIQNKKAAEEAKEIKEYTVKDVYQLIKEGGLYIVKVDGIKIGAASSKEDAETAIEILKHFTEGKPLNKETLYGAMQKAAQVMGQADDIADSGVEVKKIVKIEGKEYVIDETKELYTVDGRHICNVADVIDAKIPQELLEEILAARIAKELPEEEEYEDWEEEDEDDNGWCCYNDEEDDDWR